MKKLLPMLVAVAAVATTLVAAHSAIPATWNRENVVAAANQKGGPLYEFLDAELTAEQKAACMAYLYPEPPPAEKLRRVERLCREVELLGGDDTEASATALEDLRAGLEAAVAATRLEPDN